MAVLTDLPNEIIRHICTIAQVAESNDSQRVGYNAKVCNRTLVALCRTCHGTKNMAQDILYHSVSLPWDGEGSLMPLWLLARTILSRTDLAQKVKNLILPTTPQAAIELTTPADLVSMAIEHLFLTQHQRSSQKLWSYEVLHTLLCHLPNVETLRFTVIALDLRTFQGHIPSEILGQMRQDRMSSISYGQTSPSTTSSSGSDPRTHHQSLKALDLTYDKISQLPIHIDLKELGSIFQLSALRSFTARRRQIVSDPNIPHLLPKMTENLVDLALVDCSIDVASLVHLCAVITHLQHFALTIVDPLSVYRGTLFGQPQLDQVPHIRQPTPQQMINALRCRAPTLQSLRLDCSEWFHAGCEALWGHDGTDPEQRYPSLKDFNKLTTLNVEMNRICRPAELPESLIALTLTRMPPTPCLTEEPLYHPRLGSRYRKLILDGICPSLRYVKLGRFVPFRYDRDRVLDWRCVSPGRWDDFYSERVSFVDPQYKWGDEYSGEFNEGFEVDAWHDDWWDLDFKTWWPKELATDILAFVHREAQTWIA